MTRVARILVPVLVCIALAGCPRLDDSTAGAPGSSPLYGTWFGPYTVDASNAAMVPVALQVDVDMSGRVTRVSIGGANQNLTGTITVTSEPRVFSLQMSNGTSGLMIPDEAFGHATVVMNVPGYPMAALQKGATALPAYQPSDIEGTWSGTAVAVDGAFTPVSGELVAGVACASSGCAMAFVGPDAEPFAASPTGARYAAAISGTTYESYEYMLLTPDRTFAAGAVFCAAGPLSTASCMFTAWKRSPARVEVEPNSTYGTAMDLSLPVVVRGTVAGTYSSWPSGWCGYIWSGTPPTDADYYRFTLAQPGTVMFLLNGDGGDMDFLLCSQDGASIKGGSVLAGSLEYKVYSLPAGSYMIGVLPADNPAPTAYGLAVVNF